MSTVLEEAQKLIEGIKREEYGPVGQHTGRVARFWSIYTGIAISPGDVILMMILFKISREKHAHKRDNLVDICGYTYCLERLLDEDSPTTS